MSHKTAQEYKDGLITFRVAMILSALRMMEDGDFPAELPCLDTGQLENVAHGKYRKK